MGAAPDVFQLSFHIGIRGELREMLSALGASQERTRNAAYAAGQELLCLAATGRAKNLLFRQFAVLDVGP